MPPHHDVVVVGGGITGLAAAWWLHQAGVDVVVLERDAAVGGTMKTEHDGDWLIETGPNSALETTPLLRKLSAETGAAHEFVYASDAAEHRYILRGDLLHSLPMKPAAFVKSRLWSLPGKLRLLKEPFIGRAVREETVAEFVTRRLGSEFLDYAVNPFVAGVYAGNPEELSVQAAFPKLYALEKNYGGLIRGQIFGARERKMRTEKSKDRSRLFSYRRGMQTLPDAIGASLGGRVRTNVRVERLIPRLSHSPSADRSIRVTGKKRRKDSNLDARAVIVAVPSHAAASILRVLDAELANSLKNIYYPPVAEVFLGYKSDAIHHPLDGFGFLVPATEGRKILGTIWSSTLFRGRAPSGYAALTTFVGGSRQPELCEFDDAQLVDLVARELGPIMDVVGEPAYSCVHRWERAIPQYRLGHLAVIRQIEEFEKRNPGFFICGNYRGGIAVGDCVMNAEATVRRVTTFLGKAMSEISA